MSRLMVGSNSDNVSDNFRAVQYKGRTNEFLWGGGIPDKRFYLAIRYDGSLLKDFSQPLLVLYKVSFPHQYSLQARQGLLVLCNKRYQKFFYVSGFVFPLWGTFPCPRLALRTRLMLHVKRLVRLAWLKRLLCRLNSSQYELIFSASVFASITL